MKTTKEKVLQDFPHLKEKVVCRLHPVGEKGFGTLKNYLQIWEGEKLVCEGATTKKAYQAARQILSRKK